VFERSGPNVSHDRAAGKTAARKFDPLPAFRDSFFRTVHLPFPACFFLTS
jgi:hypothetical protein